MSKEGHRYELTWRPTLTGRVWSVRHQSTDGKAATTGTVVTVLTGMRVDSAERAAAPEPEAARSTGRAGQLPSQRDRLAAGAGGCRWPFWN